MSETNYDKQLGVAETRMSEHDRRLASVEEKSEKFIDEHTSVPRFGYTVHVIAEIPRNDSGKVQYSALEKMI